MNDAPTASGVATLAAIIEDALSPAATIESLFTNNFSDATDQVTGGSSTTRWRVLRSAITRLM